MVGPRDEEDRDAAAERSRFTAELRALVADAGGTLVHDDGDRFRIAPIGDDGFAVEIAVEDTHLAVTLGGFVQRERLDDEATLDEALDLVAAALWGRIRIVERRAGGRVRRGEVVFGEAASARTIGGWGGGWLQWRPGATAVVRRNAGTASPAAAPGGASPVRPWVGVRGSALVAPARALAVDGELDLHPFSPKDVAPLVREYIDVCRRAGVLHLRIVHGKGIGNLRRTVQALLDRHPDVLSHRLGGAGAGGWGATLVELRPPGDDVAPGDDPG